MKIAKWNEKVSAMFDDASMYDSDNLRYANDSDGAYFCTTPYQAYFMPGMEILTAKMREDHKAAILPWIFHTAIEKSNLASETRGKANGKMARRFSCGDIDVFCYEKFLRVFPKNALFYVSAPTAPILVGLWDNDRLHTIGIVMPFRCREDAFCAA